jgi:hypothetical protein
MQASWFFGFLDGEWDFSQKYISAVTARSISFWRRNSMNNELKLLLSGQTTFRGVKGFALGPL